MPQTPTQNPAGPPGGVFRWPVAPCQALPRYIGSKLEQPGWQTSATQNNLSLAKFIAGECDPFNDARHQQNKLIGRTRLRSRCRAR
jgi:hypothetical protein